MKKAWTIGIVAILTGIIFSIGMFKVPPTMVLVMKEMNAGLGVAGLLMSMVGLASTVLALPGGAIMQKIGPKKLGLASIAFALVGNILGAVSQSMSMLLVSRLIEGIGFGMIGLVVPAIIAAWFPAEKRGLPMAIWTLWISIGMLAIFNVTNVIVPSFGWRGVWWFATILFVAAAIIFGLFIKLPEAGENPEMDTPAEKVSILEGFKAPGAWMLAIIFCVFGFGNGAFTGFYPTYLVKSLGMNMAVANSYSSVATVGMMIGGILMGIILNRIKNKNHGIVMIACLIITGIFFYFQFKITSVAVVLPFMIAIGIVFQMIPPIIFTMAPDVATRVETIPATMGIIMVGQNLGGIFSTAVVGAVVERAGGVWDAATIPLVSAILVGLVAAVVLQRIVKNKNTINVSLKQAERGNECVL